jgi:hypothetical protein
MPVAVDVVQAQRQRFAEPAVDPAARAVRGLQTVGDQPPLEVGAAARGARGEQIGRRQRRGAGNDIPAPDRGVPGVSGEPEGGDALVDAVAGFIEAANGLPVVPARAALVHRVAQPPGVIADGRLADAEPACDLRSRQAVIQEPLDRRSGSHLPDGGRRRRGRRRRVCGHRPLRPRAVVPNGVGSEAQLERDLSHRATLGKQSENAITKGLDERMFASAPDGLPAVHCLYSVPGDAQRRQCTAGWCNGSTAGSGPVSLGSSPSPAAWIALRLRVAQLPPVAQTSSVEAARTTLRQ